MVEERPEWRTGKICYIEIPALDVARSVLNDWPDEPDRGHPAPLRRSARQARPPGAIAVLGGVAADEAPRALGIDMLVAGGKTSTLTGGSGLRGDFGTSGGTGSSP